MPHRSKRHPPSYGLKGLDAALARHIDFDGGFFVEAGANDGIAESNTLLFERHRNWTGLLIEPVPQLAQRCRVNRPNTLVEQVALVSFDHPDPTIRVRYSDLMSVVDGARGSETEDIEWAELGFSTDGNSPSATVPRTIEVRAQPLSGVLDQHGITHVDLLSLDVEGYEPSVLRGLDFRRHGPSFIVVEVWSDAEVDELLLGNYARVDVLCSHEFHGHSWNDVLYRRHGPSP
jgi:FkbM family methyltransferase